MKEFGQLLGCLVAAIPILGAVAAVIFAVQAVIAFFPVIVGLGVLLFLGYALLVGLVNICSGKAK